ncbi:MAG: hypothetical protein F6K11_10960 [Leptolyngbya sp. SIO3F4]|nr:hypothetical protein [Leptolyngbya sp. SIO3F4]
MIKDFAIACNADGRLEAFYINEEGEVMHTWQSVDIRLSPWSRPNRLYGNRGLSDLPARATHLSATRNHTGQIQVIAICRGGGMYLCRQIAFRNWEGWLKLDFDLNFERDLVSTQSSSSFPR